MLSENNSDISENSAVQQQWIKHRAVTPIWLHRVDIFFYLKKKQNTQALRHMNHGLQIKESLGGFTCSGYTKLILCGKRDRLFWDISALILGSIGESDREDGQRETWNKVCGLESNPQYPSAHVFTLYTENMRSVLSKQEKIILRWTGSVYFSNICSRYVMDFLESCELMWSALSSQ